MTAKEIRKITGLSQAEFSKKYNIPKRTLEKWEQGTNLCPQYVLDLLEYKVKSEKLLASNG